MVGGWSDLWLAVVGCDCRPGRRRQWSTTTHGIIRQRHGRACGWCIKHSSASAKCVYPFVQRAHYLIVVCEWFRASSRRRRRAQAAATGFGRQRRKKDRTSESGATSRSHDNDGNNGVNNVWPWRLLFDMIVDHLMGRFFFIIMHYFVECAASCCWSVECAECVISLWMVAPASKRTWQEWYDMLYKLLQENKLSSNALVRMCVFFVSHS